MDLTRLTLASDPSWDGSMDQYYTHPVHRLRNNAANLQQVARLICKLEKLSAQVEAMLVESE